MICIACRSETPAASNEEATLSLMKSISFFVFLRSGGTNLHYLQYHFHLFELIIMIFIFTEEDLEINIEFLPELEFEASRWRRFRSFSYSFDHYVVPLSV